MPCTLSKSFTTQSSREKECGEKRVGLYVDGGGVKWHRGNGNSSLFGTDANLFSGVPLNSHAVSGGQVTVHKLLLREVIHPSRNLYSVTDQLPHRDSLQTLTGLFMSSSNALV